MGNAGQQQTPAEMNWSALYIKSLTDVYSFRRTYCALSPLTSHDIVRLRRNQPES